MVSQNLPFGEPLAPKRPTMRKIRPPENTLKNTPCKIAENVQKWSPNGGDTFYPFDGFGLFFGVLLPRWLLEAPKTPKSRKITKSMKKMRHFFQASGLQLWPGRPSSRPQSQVQQVDFTADLQTRTNPWPQSLQCWICSGLHIRREVDLLRLVFGGAAMTRRRRLQY